MKTLFLSLYLCIISNLIFAQSVDSVLYDYNDIRLTKNHENNRFKLTNNQSTDKFENLKFVKRIAHYFQVLDDQNKVFYIGEEWKKKQKVDDFFGVCGTVPHYTMKIVATEANFEVFEDETFYDRNNKIPAKVIFKIKANEADSIVFINGENNFNFTSNFGIGVNTTHPRMIILIQNGKYFIRDNPNLKFDAIDFSNYSHSLKTMKGSLYGLLGIFDPKYKKIEKFNYYLAEAVTTSGKHVIIDINGNEYATSK